MDTLFTTSMTIGNTEVEVKMAQDHDESVSLILDGWIVCSVKSDGRLHLPAGIFPGGLVQTENGYIQVVKER